MFTLSAFGLLVAVGVALAGLAATRKLSFGHWLAVSISAVYLVGVAHFVLLPLVVDPRAPAEFGQSISADSSSFGPSFSQERT